jgi:ribosomal protein S20
MDIRVQELSTLFENLKRQIIPVLNEGENAPNIEVDIVKDTLRKMYDLLQAEPRVGAVPEEVNTKSHPFAQEANEEPTSAMNEKVKEVRAEEKSVEDKVDEEAEELLQAAKQEMTLKFEPKDDTLKEVTPPEPAPKPEPIPEEKPEPTKEKLDVNQAASVKKTEKTLGEYVTKNPIQSLKKQISINDKFQFTNELFKGKMKIYNEHVAKLDDMSSMEEAMNYLAKLQEECDWNVEEESYEQFLKYVQRRFVSY